MRLWLMLLIVLAPSIGAFAQVVPNPATPPTSQPAISPAGNYGGKLQFGAFALRLGLTLDPDGSGWKGILDSIDQNAKLPLDTVELKDDGLTFTIKPIGGSYKGTIAKDFNSIDGQWTQGGQTLPLKFERIEKPLVLNRPQEPKPPYPYSEEEVTFDSANGTAKLSGTFTKPKTGGPFPAVILISGSGPQDRNEELMGHMPFLVLADHLTRAGIAVLRYDDRGTGKSTGDFAKAVLEDFVADAQGALKFLRLRKDVDKKRVGLLGHSEGGVAGPMLAGRDADVAFIVLLAAPGVPMDQLMVKQAQDIGKAMGLSEERLQKSQAVNQRVFQIVKTVDDPAEAEKQLRAISDEQLATLSDEEKKHFTPAVIDQQIKMMTSPWFRKLVQYDPAPVLAKVKCPVLAINGEKDLQVSAKENLAGIKAALTSAGNTNVEIVEYPNLNHLFQHCETGNVTEYANIEETMSPEVLEKIATWIAARSKS